MFMSKQSNIELEDSTLAIIQRESAELGLTPEDYVARAIEKQAFRDSLDRSRQEVGGKPADEIFDRLSKKYQAMADT